jgi:hypothetical protein
MKIHEHLEMIRHHDQPSANSITIELQDIPHQQEVKSRLAKVGELAMQVFTKLGDFYHNTPTHHL